MEKKFLTGLEKYTNQIDTSKYGHYKITDHWNKNPNSKSK